MEARGRGARTGGGGGQCGLGWRGRGVDEGRRRPGLPRASGSHPTPLRAGSSPPVPQRLWSRPPSSRPRSFLWGGPGAEPSFYFPKRVPEDPGRLPLRRTHCRSRALGPSYVTRENPCPGGSVALKSGWTPLLGSWSLDSRGVGRGGGGRETLFLVAENLESSAFHSDCS